MILIFFSFFLEISWVFLYLITRDRFCKKLMQNKMTMFFLNWMSLRDFYKFLCQKAIFFIFFIFCFPIDTSMKLFITWFSKFFYLFPDWYTHENHFACNEELRHRGVKNNCFKVFHMCFEARFSSLMVFLSFPQLNLIFRASIRNCTANFFARFRYFQKGCSK